MRLNEQISWRIAARWLFGVALLALACWVPVKLVWSEASTGTGGGYDIGLAVQLIFSGAALIGSAICFSPDLAAWVATPILCWVDSVYLGTERGVPPIDYKLARMYSGQMRWELALAEYEKIAAYHPRELAAHVGGIEAARRIGDEAAARRLFRHGRRRFRDEAARLTLRQAVAMPVPSAD